MPGSTPATSQLDWLSSTTAMIVLSWSKATRDLLKSFSWGIGALRQLFASDDGAISFAACPIPSLRWREVDSNLRSLSGNVADPNRWRGKRHRASETAFPLRRDRWFESGSLQRGVRCEPDFRG